MLNSSFSGADVAQLRELARAFQDASDRLERNRMTIANQIKISAWAGPFAASFRLNWESEHTVHIAVVARALADNAARLRKNADEQDGASRAETGQAGSSTSRSSGAQPNAETIPPSNVAGMIGTLHGMKSNDGIRIQEIVGDDGVTRYVVYINGTQSSDNKFLNSVPENAASIQGIESITDAYLHALLEKTIRPKDAEIMVVGYSQGGMHGEILAQSGRYNVTDVITLDSPVITQHNNLNGANVVRLWDSNRESIGELGAANEGVFNPLTGGFRDILGALTGEKEQGIQKYYLGQSDTSEDAGDMRAHDSKQAHQQIATQFEQSQDPDDRAVRASLARYQRGSITHDFD
ncbi:GPI inositol-deacylase [Cryobacterium zhongshanensis]|uniref:GPI inositol-deacylase n=1 Tax=Cryobacterium zhongshanensis TaxID=2928153 RepID=A0AA41QW37_9MICO|nr:GPI inositol-deacylase [Cryobacterium zhongshanensis]MCI4658197.1 GPI inositol-deacylase [Cryobacterium zhongshanensis]